MAMTEKRRRLLKLASFVLLSMVIVGLVSAGGGYLFFSRNLPSVAEIKKESFPVVSEVYDENGEVIGEFFVERRYLLAYDQIPPQMVDAILSAEDSDFFEHGACTRFLRE